MFVFSHISVEYPHSAFWHILVQVCLIQRNSTVLPQPPTKTLFYNWVFLCVCVRRFLMSGTLQSVCCGLFFSTYNLPTSPFTLPPWGEEPPAGLSHLRGASIISLHPANILCWLGGKLYSLTFVSASFTSALVFYSASIVLTKAAWRGLSPWHDLSAL